MLRFPTLFSWVVGLSAVSATDDGNGECRSALASEYTQTADSFDSIRPSLDSNLGWDVPAFRKDSNNSLFLPGRLGGFGELGWARASALLPSIT